MLTATRSFFRRFDKNFLYPRLPFEKSLYAKIFILFLEHNNPVEPILKAEVGHEKPTKIEHTSVDFLP
jgi:hypothetical protein